MRFQTKHRLDGAEIEHHVTAGTEARERILAVMIVSATTHSYHAPLHDASGTGITSLQISWKIVT